MTKQSSPKQSPSKTRRQGSPRSSQTSRTRSAASPQDRAQPAHAQQAGRRRAAAANEEE